MSCWDQSCCLSMQPRDSLGVAKQPEFVCNLTQSIIPHCGITGPVTLMELLHVPLWQKGPLNWDWQGEPDSVQRIESLLEKKRGESSANAHISLKRFHIFHVTGTDLNVFYGYVFALKLKTWKMWHAFIVNLQNWTLIGPFWHIKVALTLTPPGFRDCFSL